MNQTSEPAGTKERILDAAEQLFAESGFAAASLRTITSAAQVNLAAVNYHFHSKEALIGAVFARRIGPINRERLEMLDACEARAGGSAPPLEEIIEAFFAPALRLRHRLAGRGVYFQRLMGRMYGEPADAMRSIFREQFGEVAARFTASLRRALPELPFTELLWRLHFMIGGMAHTMAGTDYLQIYGAGLCDPNDVEGTIQRLVAFMSAGLRAPLHKRPKAQSPNGSRSHRR